MLLILFLFGLITEDFVEIPQYSLQEREDELRQQEERFLDEISRYEDLIVTNVNVLQPKTDNTYLFLIVLQDGLYNAIGPDLINLWKDVILADGIYNSVHIVEINYAEPSQIREYLQSLFNDYGLRGAVMVGDIPAAYWEGIIEITEDGQTTEEYGYFPTNYYYMELDGTWTDEIQWNASGEQWIAGANERFENDKIETENWAPEINCGIISTSGFFTSVYCPAVGWDTIARETAIQRYIKKAIEFRLNPPYLPYRGFYFQVT